MGSRSSSGHGGWAKASFASGSVYAVHASHSRRAAADTAQVHGAAFFGVASSSNDTRVCWWLLCGRVLRGCALATPRTHKLEGFGFIPGVDGGMKLILRIGLVGFDGIRCDVISVS